MSTWSHRRQAEREQQILHGVNCQHELIATGGTGKMEHASSISSEITSHCKASEAVTTQTPWVPEILAEAGEKE